MFWKLLIFFISFSMNTNNLCDKILSDSSKEIHSSQERVLAENVMKMTFDESLIVVKRVVEFEESRSPDFYWELIYIINCRWSNIKSEEEKKIAVATLIKILERKEAISIKVVEGFDIPNSEPLSGIKYASLKTLEKIGNTSQIPKLLELYVTAPIGYAMYYRELIKKLGGEITNKEKTKRKKWLKIHRPHEPNNWNDF